MTHLDLVNSDFVGAESAAGHFLKRPSVVIGHGGFGTAISHPRGAYRASGRGGRLPSASTTLSKVFQRPLQKMLGG